MQPSQTPHKLGLLRRRHRQSLELFRAFGEEGQLLRQLSDLTMFRGQLGRGSAEGHGVWLSSTRVKCVRWTGLRRRRERQKERGETRRALRARRGKRATGVDSALNVILQTTTSA